MASQKGITLSLRDPQDTATHVKYAKYPNRYYLAPGCKAGSRVMADLPDSLKYLVENILLKKEIPWGNYKTTYRAKIEYFAIYYVPHYNL